MLGTFFFWLATTLRNRVVRQAARLRNPRYLVAALAGLAYFGWIFWGNAGAGDTMGGPTRDTLLVLVPILPAIMTAYWWIWGGNEGALAFTPAEVHFLFPAPLTRTQLIAFKLLRTQLTIVFGAAVFTLLFKWTGGAWYLRIVSLWLMLSIFHLHQLASSLVRASALQQGAAGLRRARLPLALFLAAAGLLGWSFLRAYDAFQAAPTLQAALGRAVDVLQQPVPSAILWPFRSAMAPLMAGDTAAWLRALPAAFLLLGLHLLWVFRSQAAFEEAAAEAGARRATRTAAVRSGKAAAVVLTGRKRIPRPPFRLHPTGRPAVALFWKNSTAFLRESRIELLLLLAVPLIALFLLIAMVRGRLPQTADIMALASASIVGWITVFGPLGIRWDLRRDLAHLDVLRSYPIDGRSLVAAELATSTVVLTLFQYAALALTLALMPFGEQGRDQLGFALPVAGAAVVVLPALNALAFVVHNALALLFPAWSKIGFEQPGGVEMMGKQLVTILGTASVVAVLLVPPLLVGGAAAARLLPAFGLAAAIPAGLAAIAAAWGEAALLVMWLGDLFDRTDAAEAGLLT